LHAGHKPIAGAGLGDDESTLRVPGSPELQAYVELYRALGGGWSDAELATLIQR
jgi:hypothetical protein